MQFIRTGAAIIAAIALTAPALADTVTCESDGRERYCSANTRGGVYLSSQLSRAGCYQGDTWGYDRGGIWVSGGCRAEFQTGYSGSNWHGDNGYNNGHSSNSSNDGATAAIAIGAILGAAVLASAASKNKSGSKSSTGTSDYQTSWNKGCDAAKKDRSSGQARDYYRHSSSFDSRSEQAYSSGYNGCWSGG